MPKKLLFFCELSAGHFNVAINLAKTILRLYGDQYETWFLVDKEFKKVVEKKVEKAKFLLYSRHPDKPESEQSEEESKQHTIEMFSTWGVKWMEQDRVKFVHNGGHSYEDLIEDSIKIYPMITKLIKGLKPDVILVDSLMTNPIGTNLGIPYVVILSASPTFIGHDQLPPPRSGLPGDYTEENRKLWQKFIEDAYHHEVFLKFMKEANDYLKNENCPINFDGRYMYYAPSPFLNVYNYPEELNYETEVVKMPGRWVRTESAVTDSPDPLPIPKKLANLPGKLIYFSLGSMASCYKPLMTRLLKMFGEMKHRFIVSTGLTGEQYELAANQYGEKFLNQLAVLQTVDMYISHCGNNSVTEACHYGTPMIGVPLFADQHDNAQRIQEKGFGVRLSAFYSTPEEFEKAIEFCSSETVKAKCKKMSDRIKRDNNLSGVCDAIVSLIN